MAYNKVVYEGETIIDLTRDTVSEDKLLMGEVAHDKSGEQITGTIENKPVSTPDIGVFPPPSSDESLIMAPRPVFLSDPTAIFGVPTNPENEDQLYLMLEPSSGFYTNGTLIATKARAEIVEPSDESVFLTADENGVLESVHVNPVNNLSPENIRYGVVVGNVGGEFKGIGDAVEANVLAGKTFSTGSLFGATGTMPDKRQIDPSIGGINTAYPTVSIWKGASPQFNTTTVSKERLFGISPQAGYYTQGNSYVGWKARSVTITPGASQQSVGSNSSDGILETVTVSAVSNLTAANIKQGVTVGGVAGNFTSDANALASQIIKDRTAYVNGQKVTGTIPLITSGRGDEIVEAGSGDTAYYAIHHIPTGYYYNNNPSTNNWAPEATVLKSKLVSYIGLTAAKVMKNQTVAGIAGTATSDANATAAQILNSKTAYVNGAKITGTMADWTNKPDNIEFRRLKDNQYQVAVHTGYHACNWTGTNTSYEYIPYASVASDIGLTAAKLAKNQTVLGIAGTYTSDANATASQILSGKTAYVNGSKITGNIASMAGTTITPSTSSQTVSCSGKYMTGNVVVNAIPSSFYGNGWVKVIKYHPSGNSSTDYSFAPNIWKQYKLQTNVVWVENSWRSDYNISYDSSYFPCIKYTFSPACSRIEYIIIQNSYGCSCWINDWDKWSGVFCSNYIYTAADASKYTGLKFYIFFRIAYNKNSSTSSSFYINNNEFCLPLPDTSKTNYMTIGYR